jgi:hypothetical protein
MSPTPHHRRSPFAHRAPATPRKAQALLVVAALISGSAAVLSTPRAAAMETGGSGETVESYLGFNSTGLSRLQRRFEELVVTCMKKEGFEYTPEGLNVPADAIDSSANREAFVKKYGYGVSTLVPQRAKGAKSPNEAYVAKLSKADRRAYNIALTGLDPDKPNPASSTGPDTKSCFGKVQTQLFGDIAKLTAFSGKIEDLQKRINADPKVVKAVREWSACMKKAGFTYAKEDGPVTDIGTRLGKLGRQPVRITRVRASRPGQAPEGRAAHRQGRLGLLEEAPRPP